MTTKEDAKAFLAKCITEENGKSHPERLPKKDLTFKEFVQQIYLKLPETLKMEGLKEHKQVLGEVCDGLEEEPLSPEEEKRKIRNPKALRLQFHSCWHQSHYSRTLLQQENP